MRSVFAVLAVPAFLSIALFDRYGVSVRVGLFIGHEYWAREVAAELKWGILASSACLLLSCVRPRKVPALLLRVAGFAGLFGAFAACWGLAKPPNLMILSADLFLCLSLCAWIPGLDVRPRAAAALLALSVLPWVPETWRLLLSLGGSMSLDSVSWLSWRVMLIVAVAACAWRLGRRADKVAIWGGIVWSGWETCLRLGLLRMRYLDAQGPLSRPLDFQASAAAEAGWLALTLAAVVLLVIERRHPTWPRSAESDPGRDPRPRPSSSR